MFSMEITYIKIMTMQYLAKDYYSWYNLKYQWDQLELKLIALRLEHKSEMLQAVQDFDIWAVLTPILVGEDTNITTLQFTIWSG